MNSTNSRFIQDLNRIVRAQQNTTFSLKSIQAEPIASTRGIGNITELKTSSEGIVSPLKEIAGTRQYYDPELITSSDGLFTIEEKQLKSIIFEDPNGQKITIEFLKETELPNNV